MRITKDSPANDLLLALSKTVLGETQANALWRKYSQRHNSKQSNNNNYYNNNNNNNNDIVVPVKDAVPIGLAFNKGTVLSSIFLPVENDQLSPRPGMQICFCFG
jgi:hypothetical protein